MSESNGISGLGEMERMFQIALFFMDFLGCDGGAFCILWPCQGMLSKISLDQLRDGVSEGFYV